MPCGDLAMRIEAATIDEPLVEEVRGYCAPLREAGVDTVILGCTHYPLVRPIIQRMLGPEATIVTSGAPLARQVEHVLGTRGLDSPRRGEGAYGFLCTGDPRRSARTARASCSCRSATVEQVRSALASAGRSRHDRDARAQRRPRSERPAAGHDRAGLRADGDRLGADLVRRDARDLHRVDPGVRAALDGRPRPRLGHRRVRDAARLDGRAQGARRHQGPPRRPHRRDPAPDRPLAARRRRLRRARRAHDLRRLRRPDGRRRHPLRVDHRRLRRARARAAGGWWTRASSRRSRSRARSRRSPAAIVDGDAAARPRLRARTRPPRSTRTS